MWCGKYIPIFCPKLLNLPKAAGFPESLLPICRSFQSLLFSLAIASKKKKHNVVLVHTIQTCKLSGVELFYNAESKTDEAIILLLLFNGTEQMRLDSRRMKEIFLLSKMSRQPPIQFVLGELCQGVK